MTLAQYLQQLAARRAVYGECDCMLAVADWVRELTGCDEGARYRGTYSTEQGWRDVVARAGGAVNLIDEACRRIGLVYTLGALQPGDVGVVDLPKVGATGGIYAGHRWAFMSDSGLAAAAAPRLRVLTAWGLRPCP